LARSCVLYCGSGDTATASLAISNRSRILCMSYTKSIRPLPIDAENSDEILVSPHFEHFLSWLTQSLGSGDSVMQFSGNEM
jgi:hypothetical protein